MACIQAYHGLAVLQCIPGYWRANEGKLKYLGILYRVPIYHTARVHILQPIHKRWDLLEVVPLAFQVLVTHQVLCSPHLVLIRRALVVFLEAIHHLLDRHIWILSNLRCQGFFSQEGFVGRTPPLVHIRGACMLQITLWYFEPPQLVSYACNSERTKLLRLSHCRPLLVAASTHFVHKHPSLKPFASLALECLQVDAWNYWGSILVYASHRPFVHQALSPSLDMRRY